MRKYWGGLVVVLGTLVTVMLLGIVLGACGASGQTEPDLAPRAVRAAEKCARDYESCFFVHVTNDQYYRAVLKFNGIKVGEVEGNSHDSFPFPYARLKDGRCFQVEVRLIGPSWRATSTEECLRPGGYFTFQIDGLRKLWLTAWGGV